MRRNITATALAVALALSMFATAASAQEGSPLDEPHDHALLIGVDVEFVDGPLPYVIHGFDRCVSLAGGNHVPLHAHHDRVHMGRAGEALLEAGHLVVPLGLLGFGSCAELEAALPFPPQA